MRNIAVLDTETSGVDTMKDRVCQIGLVITDYTLLHVLNKKEALINPGMPIPAGATAIHGITDEMVKDAPTFAQYAKALFELIKDCDIATFNGLNFDIPLLSEEFARCGIVWPLPGTMFIDAFVIYRDREKRDLSAAVKFYTGKEHEGAHGAAADCMGTLAVIHGQMAMYDDLAGMDTAGLHAVCWGKRVDIAGKIVLNDDGEAMYGFGKDMGKTIKENPGFAQWMLKPEQSFPSETKRVIRQLLGYK